MPTTIETILKLADVTTAREWGRSVARIQWETGHDGGCEVGEIDLTASLFTVIPNGTALPAFEAHALHDLATAAAHDAVAELLEMDGIDTKDADGCSTIDASVPDDGISITFNPNDCRITVRCHVTGHATRTLEHYV